MTHEVKVVYKQAYFLEEEVETEVEVDDDGCGEISFLIDYIPEQDEDGYNPPKYFVLDGGAERLAREELQELGLDNEYEVNGNAPGSVQLSTIYVFATKQRKISKDDLRRCKMSWLSVPIQRKSHLKRKFDTENE